MHRFLLGLALIAVGAVPAASQGADRGRPVILLVHGRGMADRDTAGLRRLWLGALESGAKTLTSVPVVSERDVRLVWYADALDPRTDAGCDYKAGDLRARRESESDPTLKGFVSVIGNVLGAFADGASDKQASSTLRDLAGDAAFLSDARKRCATEQRLGDALARARAEGRPVIIVAHSLGSIVAYDYLSAQRDSALVQQLVSVGSPVGAPDLRRLLIGGDSTDAFVRPPSVRAWTNVRNDGDPLAAPLPFGTDTVVTPPADEADPHEMVGYLRNTVTARIVLRAWCDAFVEAKAPASCTDVTRNR